MYQIISKISLIRKIQTLYIPILLYLSSIQSSCSFITSLLISKSSIVKNKNWINKATHHQLNTHIAIIPDGNSRWANKNFQPVPSGHIKGAQILISSIRHIYKSHPNISCLTVYAFSAENWKRAKEEIHHIWSVAELFLKNFEQEALEKNIVIRMVGDWDDERVPQSFRTRLTNLQEKQQRLQGNDISQNRTLTVALALNYGGQQDILSAVQQISKEISTNSIDSSSLSESMFRSYLSTGQLPDLDLVIRTGGERRISNFLLWDIAYAELYFSDVLWPDFDETCFDEALEWFATRERRFGGRIN